MIHVNDNVCYPENHLMELCFVSQCKRPLSETLIKSKVVLYGLSTGISIDSYSISLLFTKAWEKLAC